MELGLFSRAYEALSAEDAFKMISQHQLRNVEISANRGSLHFDLETCLSVKAHDHWNELIEKYQLKVTALSIHRDTQLVLGPHGEITKHFFEGDQDAQINFGITRAKLAATVAKEYGIPVVVGLLGSDDFSQWYPWPSKNGWEQQKEVARQRWGPILEFYSKLGLRFAHEIGPQQIAYNLETAEEINALFGNIDSFGFCIDPSHLLLVGVNPCIVIERLGDKVFNFHAKDAELTAYLPVSGWMAHGDLGRKERGFRFRTPGWGDLDWKKMLTSLKSVGYNGAISIEIQDAFMSTEEAIGKAIQFLKPLLFF